MNTSKLITDRLAQMGKSDRWLAAQLDKSNTLVGLWRHGANLPSPADIRQLSCVLGIPLLALVNAAQRDAAARSMARSMARYADVEAALAASV